MVLAVIYPLQSIEHLVGYLDIATPPAYSGVVDCVQKVTEKVLLRFVSLSMMNFTFLLSLYTILLLASS